MNRLYFHLILSFTCLSGEPALATESAAADSIRRDDELSQARHVRARKLVRRFADREMTMVLRSGEFKVGRLRTLHGDRFVLHSSSSGDTMQVSTREVDRVILRAGATEVLLSAVTAFGIGALAAGVLALTGSVDAAGVVLAGGLGSAAGAGLGWRTFHRDTTIRLE